MWEAFLSLIHFVNSGGECLDSIRSNAPERRLNVQVLQTLRHLLRRHWVTCRSRCVCGVYRAAGSAFWCVIKWRDWLALQRARRRQLGATHVSPSLSQDGHGVEHVSEVAALMIMTFDKAALQVKYRRSLGSYCSWQEVKWHFHRLVLMVRWSHNARQHEI